MKLSIRFNIVLNCGCSSRLFIQSCRLTIKSNSRLLWRPAHLRPVVSLVLVWSTTQTSKTRQQRSRGGRISSQSRIHSFEQTTTSGTNSTLNSIFFVSQAVPKVTSMNFEERRASNQPLCDTTLMILGRSNVCCLVPDFSVMMI